MILAPNTIYALTMKEENGNIRVNLFHTYPSGQVDIAMRNRTDTFIENLINKFHPEIIKRDRLYSHDHWLDERNKFQLVASHVTDASKLTRRDYKRLTKKAIRLHVDSELFS